MDLKFASDSQSESVVVASGARALLSQEIRNARGGQYTLKVRATAVAASADEFERTVRSHARLRLVLFRFHNMHKDPRAVTELASVEFRPVVGESGEFVLDRFLGSTTPGANFSIGSGLGALVALEITQPLTLPAEQASQIAIRVESVELSFQPRQRDDSVTA